jgi:uncharacterized RDD family membrane protein YckC
MEKVGLGKRIVSIIYDFLILFFIIIVSTFIIQQIIIQLELATLEQIQISKDETISMIPADSFVTLILKNLWVAISFFYFGHYWTKCGQTLGMKVWKIKAVTDNGGLMSWGNAFKRYVFALLGLGFLWMIIDKENLPLQDRLSMTKLIISV